ncbi:MAG: DUF2520 domain-containing protein [Bacteroidaceae bacterium]|nr:DUF2520 domain-containing protein [Bacteroidaceae bacterium]
MKIVILGAGNVASHLARAFSGAGHKVAVWNRSESSLKLIAGELGCPCTTDMEALPKDADAYIISVRDDAVDSVAEQLAHTLGKTKATVAHTAGSLPKSLLDERFEHGGVLYPMQTFSRDKALDYKEIPFFVEEQGDVLKWLALTVSEHVFSLTSEQRKVLHLASVFACNFSNHCYTIAEDILKQIDIPFAVLLPLIKETTQKASILSPREAQTGPAVREDETVLGSQIDLLDSRPDLRDIYIRMSNSIIKYKE